MSNTTSDYYAKIPRIIRLSELISSNTPLVLISTSSSLDGLLYEFRPAPLLQENRKDHITCLMASGLGKESRQVVLSIPRLEELYENNSLAALGSRHHEYLCYERNFHSTDEKRFTAAATYRIRYNLNQVSASHKKPIFNHLLAELNQQNPAAEILKTIEEMEYNQIEDLATLVEESHKNLQPVDIQNLVNSVIYSPSPTRL